MRSITLEWHWLWQMHSWVETRCLTIEHHTLIKDIVQITRRLVRNHRTRILHYSDLHHLTWQEHWCRVTSTQRWCSWGEAHKAPLGIEPLLMTSVSIGLHERTSLQVLRAKKCFQWCSVLWRHLSCEADQINLIFPISLFITEIYQFPFPHFFPQAKIACNFKLEYTYKVGA